MAGLGRRNSLTAAEISRLLSTDTVGDPERTVSGVAFIQHAGPEDLAFIGNANQLNRLESTEALVIIVPVGVRDQIAETDVRTFVFAPEPEAAFLLIAEKLVPPRPKVRIGISSRACVAETALIGTNTNVHPFACVGNDVVIGEDCEIGPGAFIGDGVVLGDGVRVDANVVLYADTVVGNHVTLRANCVIGAEGFGYRTVNGRHQRLPHVGIVRICDHVEVGAGTTIDRAKMGETVIGEGTKIDAQVMVAHNCRIGQHNLLVSQTGIAGSCTTGSYVVCAGQSGIADHVHLGDGAVIGAKAGVHRDMPGGQAYLGSPARNAAEHARELSAMRRLPEMRTTLRQLEKQVAALQELVQQRADQESTTQQSADRNAA